MFHVLRMCGHADRHVNKCLCVVSFFLASLSSPLFEPLPSPFLPLSSLTEICLGWNRKSCWGSCMDLHVCSRCKAPDHRVVHCPLPPPTSLLGKTSHDVSKHGTIPPYETTTSPGYVDSPHVKHDSSVHGGKRHITHDTNPSDSDPAHPIHSMSQSSSTCSPSRPYNSQPVSSPSTHSSLHSRPQGVYMCFAQ
jgi:hypothetical protein